MFPDLNTRSRSIVKRKSTSTSDAYEKAVRIITAWETKRPGKIFFRQSLEDFQKIVAPSAEARRELAEIEELRRAALARRNEADRVTRRAVLRIVNAVKGDPDEGEDGDLLVAMGYMPHTARSSLMSAVRRGVGRGAKVEINEMACEEKP